MLGYFPALTGAPRFPAELRRPHEPIWNLEGVTTVALSCFVVYISRLKMLLGVQ